MQKRILLLNIILAGLLIASVGNAQQPRIGEAAPQFQLISLDGDTVALANLRGKFVVIHFAASW